MKFRGLTLLVVGLCGIAWAADEPAPTLTPIVAGAEAGPHATKFAPMAYFNENCARCHGENGSFYGDDMGKGRDDESLREIVDEMASGPAQAPLAPAELDAVTAWHRAFRDKKPFVALVKAEKVESGWQLSGEISPSATLQINGEAVEVKGATWTFCVATDAVKLRATKGDAVTEVDANAAAFGPKADSPKPSTESKE